MKIYVTARLNADLLSIARVMRALRRSNGNSSGIFSFRSEGDGAVEMLRATVDYPGSPKGLLCALLRLPNVLEARVWGETGLNGSVVDFNME